MRAEVPGQKSLAKMNKKPALKQLVALLNKAEQDDSLLRLKPPGIESQTTGPCELEEKESLMPLIQQQIAQNGSEKAW